MQQKKHVFQARLQRVVRRALSYKLSKLYSSCNIAILKSSTKFPPFEFRMAFCRTAIRAFPFSMVACLIRNSQPVYFHTPSDITRSFHGDTNFAVNGVILAPLDPMGGFLY